jgi:hypothetical protein
MKDVVKRWSALQILGTNSAGFLMVALWLVAGVAAAQTTKRPAEKELYQPKSGQVKSGKLLTAKINDFITIPVPEDFKQMNDDELAAKYPSGRKPLAMFSSFDLLTNFGVNATNTAWEEKDLAILKDFQKANIRTLYENAAFTRDEIVKIGKKQFAVFEFVGDGSAEGGRTAKYKQYYYMMYCIVRKQVYVFNFNCPNTEKQAWQPMVQKMMAGVKVMR